MVCSHALSFPFLSRTLHVARIRNAEKGASQSMKKWFGNAKDPSSQRIRISSFEGPRLNNVNRLSQSLHSIPFIQTILITGSAYTIDQKTTHALVESVKHWEVKGISIFSGTSPSKSGGTTKNDLNYFVRFCKEQGIETQIGMPGGSSCIHEIDKGGDGMMFEETGDNLNSLKTVVCAEPDFVCTNLPVLAMNVVEMMRFQVEEC